MCDEAWHLPTFTWPKALPMIELQQSISMLGEISHADVMTLVHVFDIDVMSQASF